MLTDPIADMFTRIRNANLRERKVISFPFSKLKWNICEVLKKNGFLLEYWVRKDNKTISVKIKYFNKSSAINELKRISKPSQQISLPVEKIRKKCLGRRLYLFSTHQGILTKKETLEKNVGGILIGFVS